MAHKKNIGAEIVKTYSFKVKNTNGITMEKLMSFSHTITFAAIGYARTSRL